MSELPFIICPGCDALIDPTRSACPGCGRCPGCGVRRVKTVLKICPKCDLPYGKCCGRCPQCLDLRYSEIEPPCENCGHPNDKSNLEDLVRYHAAVGAEKRPVSIGCIVAGIAFSALFIWSLITLKAWLH